MVELPEPGDGTRLEFVHGTDVYAMWRDDESSRAAGWKVGAGGETWCLYGQSVPHTWGYWCRAFGESLASATRLYTEQELQQAVDAAVAVLSMERIGQHVVTPDGYCQTDGVHHSPTELERLRQREGVGDEAA